jgi:hypothetical protein
MQRRGNSYRIRICQSDKQTAYVYWKYEKSKNLCQTTQEPKLGKNNDFSKVEFSLSSGAY